MLVLFSQGGILMWLCDDEASRSTTVRLGFRGRLANARESLEWNADSIHFHTLQCNHVIFICGGLDMEESLSSTNWYNADLNEIRLVMSSDWINDLSPPLTYHLIISTAGDGDVLFLLCSARDWFHHTQQLQLTLCGRFFRHTIASTVYLIKVPAECVCTVSRSDALCVPGL